MDIKKKKFILGCGVSWCGTTSLHRTLTINNHYLHTGFKKESFYLTCALLYENNIVDPIKTHKDFFFNQKEDIIYKYSFLEPCTDIVSNNGLFYWHDTPYNTEEYLSVVRKFTLDQINYYLTKPYTLDKYLNYINSLSEYSEGIFDAVGDFANRNFLNVFSLETEFDKFKKELEKNFDFKFLMILRDPIRCYFSKRNFGYYQDKSKVWANNHTPVSDMIIEEVLSKKNILDNYSKFIRGVQNKYGKENIHYVIMEDFFNGNKDEVFKLEQFLDTKIKSIYPCAFVPDKGINAPQIPYLEDQWDSDHEILTPELYNFIFNQYKFLYDEFEELHGSLPADWGHPIDYGY